MLEAPMAPVVSLSVRNIATMENAWNPTFVNASPDMVGALAQNVSQYYTFLGYLQLAVSSLFLNLASWSKAFLLKILVIVFPCNNLQSEKNKFFISHFAAFETEIFSVLFSLLTYLVSIPILKINFVDLLLSTSFTSPET